MAVVHPLYYSSGSLRKISLSQLSDQQDYGTTLWGKAAYRSVNLSRVASDGALRRMLDTRDIAGDRGIADETNAVNTTSFANNTPDNVTDAGASFTYDMIDRTLDDSFSTDGLNYPVYRNSDGDLQIMTRNDVRDTYIDQIVDNLVSSTERGGQYRISTQPTTLTNHTRISSNPVFTDKQFDKSLHGGVTSTTQMDLLPLSNVDKPTTIESYYLYRRDEQTAGSFLYPLYWTGSNLRMYSPAEWENFLGTQLAVAAYGATGYRIRYQVAASGVDAETFPTNLKQAIMGTAMVDTTLSSSVRINDQDADNYRSAKLPTGASETETTYTLQIYRV